MDMLCYHARIDSFSSLPRCTKISVCSDAVGCADIGFRERVQVYTIVLVASGKKITTKTKR